MPRGIAVTFLGASKHHPVTRAAAYVIHELGHLLGANHDWQIPATIMHADLDGSVYWLDSDAPEIRFSKNSKKEIKKCLKKQVPNNSL
jgi:predicted Zn-dependent protease